MNCLTNEHYEAFQRGLRSLPGGPMRDAVKAVLANRPKPLADGLYLVEPDYNGNRSPVFVKGGHWSDYAPRPDGTLYDGGFPLSDDTSGWTRVPVPPEFWEEVYQRTILAQDESEPCADHAPEPTSESVTVTLPRDVVERAQEAAFYAKVASVDGGDVTYADRMEQVELALVDALDAASATQGADQDGTLAARLAAVESLARKWALEWKENPTPTNAEAARYGAAKVLRAVLDGKDS